MTEIFWFSEQPYGHVTDADLEPYESGRMHFPNTHFDPIKAHHLYNNYHDQYAWADEMGFDGIMTNEHHSAYWCMKLDVLVDVAAEQYGAVHVRAQSWATIWATRDDPTNDMPATSR